MMALNSRRVAPVGYVPADVAPDYCGAGQYTGVPVRLNELVCGGLSHGPHVHKGSLFHWPSRLCRRLPEDYKYLSLFIQSCDVFANSMEC